MSHLTYPEALVVGLIQGVTELFPLSSLGHNVLVPALVGGAWARQLNVAAPKSPYLAFIVGMHVATAIAMITYFWRDWLRIITGFFTSIWHRRVHTADERLAWMIILATIPVGIAGLALEHLFRVAFSKPVPTALFLAANGVILFTGERLRGREARTAGQPVRASMRAGRAAAAGSVAAGSGSAATIDTAVLPVLPLGVSARGRPGRVDGRHSRGHHSMRQRQLHEAIQADRRLARIGYAQAVVIGAAQILALLPGISRDGVVMVGGMFRGLTRQDAMRLSLLLSAPVILAAGVLKVPDLMGPLGDGVRGQILAGSVLSGVGAYLALRLFVGWIQKADRTLTPFAIYCLVVGVGSAVYLSIR